MFRGRPLSERTVYTHDDAGRLVSSQTVREAAWLPSDRWLALALEQYERGLCPGCGQPRWRAWHPGMRHFYEVEEHDCYACRERNAVKAESASTYLEVIDTRPRDESLGPMPESTLLTLD